MWCALSQRTGQIVEANRELRRQPDRYKCPKCGVPVDLRAGQWRDAYFAHRAHQADTDCEDYFPGESPGQPISIWRRPQRPVVAIDERVDYLQHQAQTTQLELGDSLATFELIMSIGFLEEFRLLPARELQARRFLLKSNGTVIKQISLLNIMTSGEATRVTVPPSCNVFEFEVIDRFGHPITGITFDSVEGLSFEGNVFCRSEDSWVRIFPGSQVTWGEELGFVALEGVTPPAAIVVQKAPAAEHKRTRWSLWRLKLPDIPDERVEAWFEAIRYRIAQPRWELEILSIPEATKGNDELVFLSKEPLILKLNSPYDGADSILNFDSSDTVLRWPVKPRLGMRTIFGALSFGNAEEFSIWLDEDERSRRYVGIVEKTDLNALPVRTAELPQLILRIGDDEFYPFCSRQLLERVNSARASTAKFSIFGLREQNIDFRVAVLFSGSSHSYVGALSLKAAESEIARILSLKRPGRLKIDAGGFGVIDIEVAQEQKVRRTLRKSRIEYWLRSLAASQLNPEFQCGPRKWRDDGDCRNEYAFGSLLDASAAILSRKRWLARLGRNK